MSDQQPSVGLIAVDRSGLNEVVPHPASDSSGEADASVKTIEDVGLEVTMSIY